MSLNQRGRIVGQVVYPRVSADKKQKGHPVARPRPSVPPQDIIEISSDEDDEKTPPPPKRSPTNRVNQSTTNGPGYNARLDQQFQKLKRREEELERLVAIQKNEIEAKKFRGIPKVDEIEEELTCDICAMRMWTPYRLTECGHVFCLGCLLNWFDDAHARFLDTHPGYTPLPPQLKEVLRRPLEFPQECGRAYTYMSQFPGPQYTCPSCRTAVIRRPIEDFKVKALVSWLCSVQGVEPPESRIPPGKGDTVFDGYSLI